MDTKLTKVNVASRAALTREGVRVNITGRRTYSEAYKRAVVDECLAPNVSIAAIGMKHGINDNLLRRWIRAQQSATAMATTPLLLPVKIGVEASMREASDPTSPVIGKGGCIEIDIGEVRIRVRGAVDADTLSCVLNELRRS